MNCTLDWERLGTAERDSMDSPFAPVGLLKFSLTRHRHGASLINKNIESCKRSGRVSYPLRLLLLFLSNDLAVRKRALLTRLHSVAKVA